MSNCTGRTPFAGGSRTIAGPELTAADRAALLALARAALAAHLAGRSLPSGAVGPGASLKRGAFVTLTERHGGALRGCVGHIAADRELGAVVRDMAIAAARDDPRFVPVEPGELAELTVEISVLSQPARSVTPVDPARIRVGRDGVLVRRGSYAGLLLPQVAREHHWDSETLLAAACRKADLPPLAWREPGTEVFTFQADVFGETGEEGRGTRDE